MLLIMSRSNFECVASGQGFSAACGHSAGHSRRHTTTLVTFDWVAGDRFFVRDGKISFPPGTTFSVHALACILPQLVAREQLGVRGQWELDGFTIVPDSGVSGKDFRSLIQGVTIVHEIVRQCLSVQPQPWPIHILHRATKVTTPRRGVLQKAACLSRLAL